MTHFNVRTVFSAAAVSALAVSAQSQIVIDGDFSDFDASTIVYQDDGSGTGQFITDIRVTNDENNVYFNYNLSQSVIVSTLSTFSTIDVDQAPLIDPGDGNLVPSTGFNFFGQGIGVDAAFQNDFPFQPAGDGTTELFNANGVVIPAAFFGGDGVSTGGLKNADGSPLFGTFSDLFGAAAAGVEFSVAIDGTLGDGTPLFTLGEEFGLLIGFDVAFGPSSIGTGVYTPTVVPEPASLALLGLGSFALLARRRGA